MRKFLSIDVGGTAIKYGIVLENLEIIKSDSIKTRKTDKENFILEDILSLTRKILKEEKVDGIGISTAGVVDPNLGEIIYAGKTIPNYKGTKIKEAFLKEFKLNVSVLNDVNAAALGEYHSKSYVKSMFMATIGTGIGGAIILNGEILSGNSFSAGEVGYINVKGNQVQDIASTEALVEKIKKIKNLDNISGKDVFDMAEKGDKDCIVEIDNLIDNLTDLLVNVIYIINPEKIILGGGIMERKDYMIPRINKNIKNKLDTAFYESVSIESAILGNKAGLIGAVVKLI